MHDKYKLFKFHDVSYIVKRLIRFYSLPLNEEEISNLNLLRASVYYIWVIYRDLFLIYIAITSLYNFGELDISSCSACLL